MTKNILIILVFIFFYSCSESTPSGIIKPKKMQEILWDIIRADALAKQLVKNDSAKILVNESAKLTKEILLIHNIEERQFEKSYSYYTHHPDIMRVMFDSISAQQTRNSPIENTNKYKRLFDKSSIGKKRIDE